MANPSELTEEQRKQWEEKIKKMSPEELKELQRQQCVFCQIIAEKVPSQKVYEDEICIAAMDISPAAKGHMLIIPKEHYQIMPQVPDQVIAHIVVIAKRLSQIMLKALRASGTTVFVANGAAAGQRAQHFFLHLIPRKEGDHVLSFQEKIISKDLVQKVKTAVENRLLELMGLERPTSKQAIINEAENNNYDVNSLEYPDSNVKSDNSAKKKINQPAKRKLMSKKSVKKNEKSSSEENTVDLQLDEIANLFK